MIKLTEFTDAGGCGCKIDSTTLTKILSYEKQEILNSSPLVIGNQNNSDFAAYKVLDDTFLVSSLDFFTPVVNSPFKFGRIAAANAVSDIYVAGGKPIFALSILGWPTDKIDSTYAKEVMQGAESVALECGFQIAGGHSIRNPQPIFGLSVNQ